MAKKNQKLIILFGILVVFFGILFIAETQKVFAISLAAETGGAEKAPPAVMPKTPPSDDKALSPEPGSIDINSLGQTPALSEEESVLAERIDNLEKRIKNIEAQGEKLEVWNLIIAALFIMSLLFNIYLALKIRYVLKKIGTRDGA